MTLFSHVDLRNTLNTVLIVAYDGQPFISAHAQIDASGRGFVDRRGHMTVT